MRKQLAFGTKLWIGLTGGVIILDTYALATDKETFSAAFKRALQDPKKRHLVTISWLLTTKHLFFGDHLKWADPFGLMALGVGLAKKKTLRSI